MMNKRRAILKEIADILATGVMRLRMRDVRNLLKKNGKTEIGLACSPPKSLYRLELAQRGRRR
jgi:hypothetical protein